MSEVWRVTNFGDLAVLLPLAVILAIWVGIRSPERAIRWFGAMVMAMALTTLTKIRYASTGTTIEPFDFRMISGHMVLSFSVWPVLAYAVGSLLGQRTAYLAAALAGIGCLIIGYTRLFGFHTPAEVVVGTLLGSAVAITTLRRWHSPPLSLPHPTVAVSLMCVTAWACYGHKAPTEDWINATTSWLHAFIG
ncbi:phosphoesterase [Robbsia sp. KACC 23696]|uniref:phosphoesterase n=1 Tax=Robbsia sp. KACC 23696 TaxID=3149231 RepID=UPI00325A8682